MKTKEIINAWHWIRENNNSIPDDVIDFMKDAAIEKIRKSEMKTKEETEKWLEIKALFQKITCNGSREMTEERFIQAMEEHTAPLTCYSKDIQKELPVLLNDFAIEIIENPNGSIRRFQNAIIELFKSPQSIKFNNQKLQERFEQIDPETKAEVDRHFDTIDRHSITEEYIEKLAEEYCDGMSPNEAYKSRFRAGFKKALSLTSKEKEENEDDWYDVPN